MTDVRADDPALDDRLPWLEAVEEDGRGEGPSALKLIVAVLIGLVAIGGVVGGIFWLGNRGAARHAGAEPELIKAQPGAYKVKPTQPGGMTVEGEGDTAFQASAGADPKGKINTAAVPEAPVQKGAQPQPPAPQQTAQAQPQPKAPEKKPAAGTIKAPAPTPAPAAASGGATIQLGSFPSGAMAEKAWKAMASRFAYLAPLSHSVVSAEVGGKTWYRLRASGPDAAGICGRLKVAGEQCLRV
ncbi:MAG: SPOR domain-containing protein [Alphaproteobacteria bacterium]|nr:SPOR domain-containing protein [Alphaproteobacteria bacterium]